MASGSLRIRIGANYLTQSHNYNHWLSLMGLMVSSLPFLNGGGFCCRWKREQGAFTRNMCRLKHRVRGTVRAWAFGAVAGFGS